MESFLSCSLNLQQTLNPSNKVMNCGTFTTISGLNRLSRCPCYTLRWNTQPGLFYCWGSNENKTSKSSNLRTEKQKQENTSPSLLQVRLGNWNELLLRRHATESHCSTGRPPAEDSCAGPCMLEAVGPDSCTAAGRGRGRSGSLNRGLLAAGLR